MLFFTSGVVARSILAINFPRAELQRSVFFWVFAQLTRKRRETGSQEIRRGPNLFAGSGSGTELIRVLHSAGQREGRHGVISGCSS